MSLFVNPQNQKLLWDMMHKNGLISRVFLNSSPQQKEEWFKTVIQLFYDRHMGKHGNRNITIRELSDMNRDTLIYMNQKLREYLMPTSNPGPTSGSNPGSIPGPTITTSNPGSIPGPIPKQNSYYEQFDQRQKEYERMNEKTAPEVANFSEKIEDQPISNMDELIRNHMKARDDELKQYSPAPPYMQPHSMPRAPNEAIPLVIDKNTNITIEIESLQEVPEKSKKSVSWQTNNSETGLLEQSRLDKLESIVLELSSKIETIISELHAIKNE